IPPESHSREAQLGLTVTTRASSAFGLAPERRAGFRWLVVCARRAPQVSPGLQGGAPRTFVRVRSPAYIGLHADLQGARARDRPAPRARCTARAARRRPESGPRTRPPAACRR